jgi:AraC-like DNA-binding protein
VRTLRRRLQDEGASYNDLARKALAKRAERLVGDVDRILDDAAYILGFSDRSAFHRAFKRWTGMMPGEYRRRGRRGHNLAAGGQLKAGPSSD